MGAAPATPPGAPSVRVGGPNDVDWAMEVAPELAAFGLPPWRDYHVFVEECRSSIRTGLEGRTDDDVVFIAISGSGDRLGLAHVLLRVDQNSGRQAVVINDFLVEPETRGTGIGALLLDRCEAWGYEHRAVALILAVFQDNVGARRFYRRFGFRDDLVRAVRLLPDREPDDQTSSDDNH